MGPFFGAGFLRDALLDLLRQMVLDGRSSFGELVDRYILNPDGFVGRGPLVDDSVVTAMYRVTSGIAVSLLVLVLLYASLRSILDHSMEARYTLKVVVPRIAVVVALITAGLPIIGGAMELNAAVSHTVWADPRIDLQGCGLMVGALQTPPAGMHYDAVWCTVMGNTQAGDLVTAVLMLILAVMLIVLAFVGVVRNVMLAILAIAAPLAFLCLILPETKTYTTMWRRLLVTTVFTQGLQALILRFALGLTFQQNTIAVVHGLVAMYVVLKVPTALHAASRAESKVLSYAKHLEHVAQMTIHHAVAPPHRVRANPAD